LFIKITRAWNFESHMQFAARCAPWNVTIDADDPVLQALQFKRYASAANSQAEQA
jgi:hypothetical protein